ncbi:hypothetical protein [Scytonema sp. NUACC26]|uniref:hypothetical protein n=1 Tax=Scytonema sp. NUACC26 TaxID=3140176 RepID=UPI0034DBB5A0
MTQAIPPQTNPFISSFMTQEQLMEGIAAEDASNGEIGCGRDWGNKLAVYLNTCEINVSDEKLRGLLREYLGGVLMETDFDSIIERVTRFIQPLVVEAHIKYHYPQPAAKPAVVEKVAEHIPSEKLRELLVTDLGDCLDTTELESIIQFSHQAIHKSVLSPRHTWPDPIWVMTTSTKVYVVQAKTSDTAIAFVKEQHPQEQGELQLIAVSGVLAPNQVIVVDKACFS